MEGHNGVTAVTDDIKTDASAQGETIKKNLASVKATVGNATEHLVGKTDKVMGSAKQAIGHVAGDPLLEADGRVQRYFGAFRDLAGRRAGMVLGASIGAAILVVLIRKITS